MSEKFYSVFHIYNSSENNLDYNFCYLTRDIESAKSYIRFNLNVEGINNPDSCFTLETRRNFSINRNDTIEYIIEETILDQECWFE